VVATLRRKVKMLTAHKVKIRVHEFDLFALHPPSFPQSLFMPPSASRSCTGACMAGSRGSRDDSGVPCYVLLSRCSHSQVSHRRVLVSLRRKVSGLRVRQVGCHLFIHIATSLFEARLFNCLVIWQAKLVTGCFNRVGVLVKMLVVVPRMSLCKV
jgi:hypothetical protein